MTGYGLDGWSPIPGRVEIFPFSIVSKPTLEPTQSPIQWIPAVVPAEVKRQEREANHSPPSSIEVKNM
jgi:hypothetical protein